jgi:hypothetical protein
LRFTAGTSGSISQGRCWIDMQDTTSAGVYVSAGRGTGTEPSIFIAGDATAGQTNTYYLTTGSISLEPDDAPTTSTKYFAPANIFVGSSEGSATAPTITIGRNARIYLISGAFNISSGVVDCYANTKSGADEITVNIIGGSLLMREFGTGENSNFIVRSTGALYFYAPAAFGTATVYGGTIDASRMPPNPVAIATSIKAYEGSTIRDPLGAFDAAINLIGCSPSELSAFEIPPHRLLDYSADATP